jgi:hypothetical protein
MSVKWRGQAVLSGLVAVVLVLLVEVVPNVEAQSPASDKQLEAASEQVYKASCDEVPVSELTARADQMRGQPIKISGQILVYEERGGDQTTTHLIISVADPAKTLPSGKLPVYVVYTGKIRSFIYDDITVYGQIHGNDAYQSVAVKKKVLPRIDAKYIEE